MTLTILRKAGLSDLKLISRDSFLMLMAFVPIILGLLFRWLLPWVTAIAAPHFPELVLTDYYPLVLSGLFILLVPMLAGQVIGFLLLDERDDGVLTALLVTPRPLSHYLFYRIGLMMVMSIIQTVIAVPLTGLVAISLGRLIAVAAVASLIAPIIALYLMTFAENKVEGMAQLKMVSGLNGVVFVAYFVAEPWQYLFGLMPVYWPAKAFWLIYDQPDSARFWLYLLLGLVTLSVTLKLLLDRFYRKTYQL
jgi:fluoroquinolone transport system permease protein